MKILEANLARAIEMMAGRKLTDQGRIVLEAAKAHLDCIERNNASKRTWITPYFEAWKKKAGGEPPVGIMLKVMKKLEELHGANNVMIHWGNYLKETEITYLSVMRFAQTYGNWAKSTAAPRVNHNHDPDNIRPIADDTDAFLEGLGADR